MSDEKLKLGDLSRPPKKEEETKTSLSWLKDGGANAVFNGVSEVPSDDDIRELIVRVGRDPEDFVWDIVSVSWNSAAWHRSFEVAAEAKAHTAYTKPSCVVKIRIQPKVESDSFLESSTREDVEQLLRDIVKRKPSKVVAPTGNRSFLVCLSDWQIGKGEGGGSEATIERILAVRDAAVRRFKELVKVGRSPDTVYLIGIGDLIESCSNFYAMQEFQTDLNLRDQIRVARRLILAFIDAFVDLGVSVVSTGVGGNHGEASRNKDGKAYTDFKDNQDVAVFETISEIIAQNPERYKNVSMPLDAMDDEDLILCLEMSGVKVAFAHGHQFKNGVNSQAKIENWWQKQALGRTGVSDAQILVTGHFHHFVASEATGRTILQVPALDGGSLWFKVTSGQSSPPGLLTLCVGDIYARGYGDLAIL